MSKTIKDAFNQHLTFDALLNAHKRAKEGKGRKKEVQQFEMDLESNIVNIMRALEEETYRLSPYREFIITEPKERLIKSLPYKDRVVHQWYIYEFIKPYMYPRFIKDTFACIDGRGTHSAKDTLQRYMRKMKTRYGIYYIVKFDIQKFFYSIDKEVLYEAMQQYISDKKLLRLTKRFIFDNEEPIGIPIGNYTSQYFANIYLHQMDLYIKQNLKIKYYVRYMDDFIALVHTKEEAKNLMDIVRKYVEKNLKVKLNQKSRYFPSTKGVEFCGYKIFEEYTKLKKRSKKNMLQKIKKWNYEFQKGELDETYMRASWNSWIAHSKHADTYHLQNKYASFMPYHDTK